MRAQPPEFDWPHQPRGCPELHCQRCVDFEVGFITAFYQLMDCPPDCPCAVCSEMRSRVTLHRIEEESYDERHDDRQGIV